MIDLIKHLTESIHYDLSRCIMLREQITDYVVVEYLDLGFENGKSTAINRYRLYQYDDTNNELVLLKDHENVLDAIKDVRGWR